MILLLDDDERALRLSLLQTGALSDLTLRVGSVTYALHAAIVALRCQFFWRRLDPAQPLKAGPRVIDVQLPDALETDGAWCPADVGDFFRWVYAAEAGPLLSPNTALQPLLRLHRLAGLFGAASIGAAIEHHITHTVLPLLASRLGALPPDDDEALREALLPPLELLLTACHADEEGRFRLGQAIVQWALTVAPTFFPVRTELRDALGASPFLRNLLCADPRAVVAAVCETCFVLTETDERVRLPGAREWVVVRRQKRIAWLLSPGATVGPALDFQHLDLETGRASPVQRLVSACREASFPVPAPSSTTTTVPGPCGPGRCQQCRALRKNLHIIVLRIHQQQTPQA